MDDCGTAGGYLPLDVSFATRAIHVGQEPEQWKSRAVVPLITTTSTFKVVDPELPDYCVAKHFSYGRQANPTRNALEKCIASLDKAKFAVCYASGMAAVSSVLQLLKSGDHVLCASDVYGGTHTYLSTLAVELGMEVQFFDPLDMPAFHRLFKPNTKMVWMETPSNPLVNIIDIRKVVSICKENSDDIKLVVDNTYLSPYFQKPLELGVHVVMYSLTKYMNGHSDAIMGAVVLNDEAMHQRLRFLQNNVGAVPSPFDCYLVNRGLKTLAVRMRAHMRGGLHVARYLEKHPHIENVLHPGLPSHPQHELCKTQSSGHSGMLSFRIKGASLKDALDFLKALKIAQFAGSLGGVETLISSPALMSHVLQSQEQRRKVGVTDNLIRLSVGLEDPEDLCKDIDQALRKVMGQK